MHDIYFYRFVDVASLRHLVWQAMKALGVWVVRDRNRFDRALGVFLSSMGVPHTMDIFFVFHTKLNPKVNVLQWGHRQENLAQYFQGWWGQFARTGNPNGGPLVRRDGEPYELPYWPSFAGQKSHGDVMRIRDPPIAMSVGQHDVEEAVQGRCDFWMKHPEGLRAKFKDWQHRGTPTDLGYRCCCDLESQPPVCTRVGERPGDVIGNSRITVRPNWLGYCPVLDLNTTRGSVQTHHDPLGCVVENTSSIERCCCLEAAQVPFEMRQDRSLICQRFPGSDLSWRYTCPKVCVADDEHFNQTGRVFERCFFGVTKRRLQSRHHALGCE